MAFLIRSVHVTAVAFIFGGALLLFLMLGRHSKYRPMLLELMRVYEWASWGAFGLVAMTGVGNLAHFGVGLPGSGSGWGRKMTLKLGLVFVLLLLSSVRTLSVGLVQVQHEVPVRAWRSLQTLYGGTAALVAGTLFVAVSLAHF